MFLILDRFAIKIIVYRIIALHNYNLQMNDPKQIKIQNEHQKIFVFMF